MARGRWARAAAWAGAVGASLLPPAVAHPGAGLDPSWVLGLHLGYERGFQWGRDLVWTYGPLGFADGVDYYSFGTWLGGLVLTLGVHVACVGAIAAFLQRLRAPLWTWLVVAAALALPLVGFPSVEYEGQLAAVAVLAIAAGSGGRAALALSVAAGFLLGLLFLVKGTGLVGAAALLAVYTAWMVVVARRARPAAAAGVSFAVTLLALWVAAGQSLGSMPAYFRALAEIVSGYTPAMSVWTEVGVRHAALQLALGGLMVAGTAVTAAAAIALRRQQLAVTACLVLPVMFLAFKEGFTRFGDRQLVFFSIAAVAQALLLAAAFAGADQPPRRVAALTAVPAAVTLLIASAFVAGGGRATDSVHLVPVWPLTTLEQRAASYREAWSLATDGGERDRLHASTVASMRSVYALDPAALASERAAPTDILPWDIDLVYAYGVRWDPRPVLASYGAYTTYLDGLDAAHFTGAGAPQRVLIADASIDGRYAPFDEPATLRALEDSYRVVGTVGPYIQLERAGPAQPSTLEPVAGGGQSRLGGWVAVPPGRGGRVYGRIAVPLSLRGRLLNVLFQPSALRIQFQLADGTVTQPYRFVPAVAGDGVDLSGYAPDEKSLARLLDGHQDQPIRAFRVVADRPEDYTGVVSAAFAAPR